MSYNKLNQLPIRQYLAEMNIYPVIDKGYYGMYHSPLREDNNASFKVDYQKNLWHDFGLGEGGTMIDLVMRLENKTVHEAICKLEDMTTYVQADMQTDMQNNSFSFQGEKENQPAIVILKVVPLTNQALLDYLTERKIKIDIAKEHCKEVYYSVNDKRYFAIGFKNDEGGYILRNKYAKVCTSSDITTYSNTDTNKDICSVFEGFMDYLSYLTMKHLQNTLTDAVILNSTSNLPKAIDFIKSHPKVYTYLDNDEGGQKAKHIINNMCKSHIDKSTEYAKYKDLNEYLCAKKLDQNEEQKRKPSRGFKM